MVVPAPPGDPSNVSRPAAKTAEDGHASPDNEDYSERAVDVPEELVGEKPKTKGQGECSGQHVQCSVRRNSQGMSAQSLGSDIPNGCISRLPLFRRRHPGREDQVQGDAQAGRGGRGGRGGHSQASHHIREGRRRSCRHRDHDKHGHGCQRCSHNARWRSSAGHTRYVLVICFISGFGS